jgi:uncharacterized Zn-binding protein involved in type VI secretion
MPAIIVLGDGTDHGGEVIEASGVTDTHGRLIARVGDKVHCPKKGHGIAEIIEGDMTFVVDGRAVAYHGCRTSCGALLISSQCVTFVDFGSDGTGVASSPIPGASPVAPEPMADEDFFYDEQLVAVNAGDGKAVQGLAYFVRTASGKTYSGFTDTTGLVPRIATVKEEALTVWCGLSALYMEGARHG